MVSRKYTGDYRLENVLDKNGVLRTVPVYRGPLFRFTAEPEALRRVKGRTLLLTAAATAALLLPLLSSAPLLRLWYAALPAALCVLPDAELWMGVRRLYTAGPTVTREHRDKIHDRFAGWSLAFAILAALSLLGQLAGYLGGCGPEGIPATVGTLAALAAAAALFGTKKALLMEPVPSERDIATEGSAE
ncbi:MAG: hypothetical protein IJU29_05615 [Oscillospiraceae bacterium]|nr:hypothetical protein [Oscillospiraceae bacterium]